MSGPQPALGVVIPRARRRSNDRAGNGSDPDHKAEHEKDRYHASLLAFGVLGLGASKTMRRSYLAVDTDQGSYIFERQELLPVALAGLLAPVMQHFTTLSDQARGATAEQFAALIEGQARTNEILMAILKELERP